MLNTRKILGLVVPGTGSSSALGLVRTVFMEGDETAGEQVISVTASISDLDHGEDVSSRGDLLQFPLGAAHK